MKTPKRLLLDDVMIIALNINWFRLITRAVTFLFTTDVIITNDEDMKRRRNEKEDSFSMYILCVNACVFICLCRPMCMCVCVCASVCACVGVCRRRSVRACIHVYLLFSLIK